jgi:cobyrinic acid a,c-diamide synthase
MRALLEFPTIPQLGPRIVIAGTHSGVGKTTVATGIMAALTTRGLRVSSAKVGPDFIDPSYHALATGRPPRTLDVFLSGESLVPTLAADASQGVDVLIVEGVMGLFDGSSVPGIDGSTASVSRLLEAPVILVVDASAMSGSVAAVVHGFATLDPRVRLGGVILNRVGSASHEELLREALEPLQLPVLGAIHNDDALLWRERHLGLVPVAEEPEKIKTSIGHLAERIAHALDLNAIMTLARSAPNRSLAPVPQAAEVGRCRIAVCGGPAFSFVYPENLELLRQAGAEIVLFDPVQESRLPDGCDALYAGGGFPEVYAAALASNVPLLDDVRHRLATGLVTWAECGGYLWLCESLDGVSMTGVLPGVHAEMTDRLTLGYRSATTRSETFFGPAGTHLRGHEFHHSNVSPAGDALDMSGRFGSARAGYASSRLFASYLHQHLSASPELAERFVLAAASTTHQS